jgi:lysophospholipase L1-like esterase
VLAEAALRIYAGINRSFGHELRALDALAAKIEPHGAMGYRTKPNSTFHYNNGTTATSNALGFRGPVVQIPKPPDTFRIVLLGESTTHGWAVNDDKTIDAYMRELLEHRNPGTQYDVVNLAFDGYDSYQLVERLRTDGLPLDPDLIIVNAGINDVRNARFPDLQDPDPRTVLWQGVLVAKRDAERLGRPTLFAWLKHVSYLARLPGHVRSLIFNMRSEKGRREIPPNPAAVEYFGRNMLRIASLVRDRAVPIVFSTPPSALMTKYSPHDTSPSSYWLADAASTEAFRIALADRMRSVVAELAREGYPARYVNHTLPPTMFLDDAHLTPEGNRQMAKKFVDAAEPYIIADLRQDATPVAGSHSKR